uniref:CalliFMRFamide-2 n=2 Tax=Oestroidea TaxID=43755 RepID=FAR2_CALVO|nr:RecName: Full=CalliFMRFamide-2 [Calliphora vomitoria]P85475.1 RecName: Full=FMRFamide-2; AltName: Full=SabFMRFamide-2 [Sarcophaga bullata]
TPSQDFMRF